MVVVLAVFEWESSELTSDGGDDSNHPATTVRRTKIRFQPGTIEQLQQEMLSVLDKMSIEDCHLEIYDPQTSAYILAVPTLSTLEETALRQRLGKVWRVRAVVRRSETLLALPGRAYSEKQGYAIVNVGTLHLCEQHNRQDSHTAFTVWDGGLLLADYLQSCPALVQGKHVLELGAGVGLVGLTAAALGGQYVIPTDLPDVLPVLQENVARNESIIDPDRICCVALDWFDPHPLPTPPNHSCWDVILLADCVWTLDLVAPLLKTIEALLHQRQADDYVYPLELLVSYQRRGHHAHQAFWNGLSAMFTIQEVDPSSFGLTLPNPKLWLRKCTPKHRNKM